MDTGGLAQMSYNNYNNGLSVPGNSYGSRTGKAGHVKRLSVAPSPMINSIHEEEPETNTSGRTSRASLLSGLRTAPRQTSGNLSAPYNQSHHRVSSDISGYNGRTARDVQQDIPHTATGTQFTGLNGVNPYAQQQRLAQQQYNMSEQVLAPQFEPQYTSQEQMDPHLYEELMATNMYLVRRQQQLQQQLMNVTAAAHQFQNMSLNAGHMPVTPAATPQMGIYHQQMQNGVQPIVTPVPNQPGVYAVYNPLTGQQNYVVDQSGGLGQLASSPPYSAAYTEENFGQEPSRTPQKNLSVTPPKKTPSPPANVTPLPAPSANAFRPGHRKTASLGGYGSGKNSVLNSALKTPGAPSTPQNGTFGPGMARAGEHPTRQPRGPPPMEELLAAPTTKYEGCKNFAARQRRRALNNLVRASAERRHASGRVSSGAGTPQSESEFNFASSETPDNSSSAADMSGRPSPSLHQLRGSVTGAIGSEWKELRERSRSRGPTPTSSNSRSVYSAGSGFGGRSSGGEERSGSRIGWKISDFDEDAGNATGFEVSAGVVDGLMPLPPQRRGTPKLVFTSADKRKSSVF